MSGRAVALTRRGWTVGGATVGLLAGGRLLGADELTVVGLAAVAILAAAVLWVVLLPGALAVTRVVEPSRVQVGDDARVDLVVRPRARGTPLLDLTEPIDADRLRARFLLAPLPAGAEARPAYRLPTDRRGSLDLGPSWAVRTDPFGLARRRRVAAPAETVLVRPRVHSIAPPVMGAGLRFTIDDSSVPSAPNADASGDFLAVRPYEVGDDPRRVHWRSSARTDDLMVRQFVAPRRGRTVVLLDTRAARPGTGTEGGAPTDERDPSTPAFERAVEAAASIVTCLQRARRPVECTTAAGRRLDDRAAPDRVLDRLATVMPRDDDLLDAVMRARRRHAAELVVLVTAQGDAAIDAAAHAAGARAPVIVVVTGGDLPRRAPAVAVDARARAFPDAWRAVTRTYRAPRVSPDSSSRPSPLPSPPDPDRSWNSAAPSHRPSPSPR